MLVRDLMKEPAVIGLFCVPNKPRSAEEFFLLVNYRNWKKTLILMEKGDYIWTNKWLFQWLLAHLWTLCTAGPFHGSSVTVSNGLYAFGLFGCCQEWVANVPQRSSQCSVICKCCKSNVWLYERAANFYSCWIRAKSWQIREIDIRSQNSNNFCFILAPSFCLHIWQKNI